MKLDRRSFLGAAGIAMAATASIAMADDSLTEIMRAETIDPTTAGDGTFVPGGGCFAEGALDLGWTGTPVEIEQLGGSTMPLAELNRRRKAYVDAQTEYVNADGSVVPAWAVKIRALINTYGIGCGNTPYDGIFNGILATFDEETAEFYLSMPMGVKFSAADAYKITGKPVEECQAILDSIAEKAFLQRNTSNFGTLYNHVPFFQGIVEYNGIRRIEEGLDLGVAGPDVYAGGYIGGGSPTLYAIPCDPSVIDTGEVLPEDDWRSIIRAQSTISLSPCYCRFTDHAIARDPEFPTLEDFNNGLADDFVAPDNDTRVFTCLQMGDEAEYWLDLGFGRRVTADEAIATIEKNVEDGLILESIFSLNTETICSCSLKGECGVLGGWKAVEAGVGGDMSQVPAFKRISHYNLVVNTETCLKCGICANRCPLQAIVMDEETGLPVVSAMCFNCGQCAYVCPTESRKLTLKPAEEYFEVPWDMLEDSNMKAAYRFEHGSIA